MMVTVRFDVGVTADTAILLADFIRHAGPEGRVTVDILIAAGANRFSRSC